MGFKSGEFLEHSNTGTWLSFSHFLTSLDLWAGSPSCMKWLHRRYPEMAAYDDQEPLNSRPLSW